MSSIVTLITDVRAAMAATWTDTKADGIFLYEQLEMIPWASLTPPFGGIVCNKGNRIEWGADKFAMTFPVEMVRVARVAGNTGLETLINDIESLWTNLIDNRLPHNTLLSFESIDWGDEIPGNAIFAAKDYQHRAARLTMNVLVGYTPG